MKNSLEIGGKIFAAAAVAFAINRAVVMSADVPAVPAQVPDLEDTGSLVSCDEALIGGTRERPVFMGTAKSLGIDCDPNAEPMRKAPNEIQIYPPPGQVFS